MSNRVRFIRCAILATSAMLLASTSEAQWGTIKGQVKVVGVAPMLPVFVKKGDAAAKDAAVCAAADVPDESLLVDPQSNGLANVVISLRAKPDKIHPDLAKSKNEEVVFNAKGCRFVPHVLLVRIDQNIRIKSDDAASHNVHPFFKRNSQFSMIVAPTNPEGYLVSNLRKPERDPLHVGCDIHPWMDGYWVVLDHSYAAVTNQQGEFEIANLPIGDHEFRVWHEKGRDLDKSYKVTVKEGLNNLEPITVTAEKLLSPSP